jgi:glucose/arabinose dehydrogenase
VLDANFVETAIPIDGFGFSSAAWAPDGSDRLFMTTKGGVTHILTGALLPEPFMALSEIYVGGECGLLGIAFDPNFGQNGYVYFFVTVSSTETRIIRYRATGNVGVEPTVIVSGLPSSATMHAGGAIAFGPDGKLYWGRGGSRRPGRRRRRPRVARVQNRAGISNANALRCSWGSSSL